MLLEIISVILLASFAQSRLINVTIDDTYGDSRTGQIPQYLPTQPWIAVTTQTENCPICTTDWTKVHNQTWHQIEISAGTSEFGSNVTFSFKGSSIYLFFILMRAFDTSLAFYVDEIPNPERLHLPSNLSASTDDLLYDQLLFSRGGLTDGEHHVVVSSFAAPDGSDISAALFDYAVYTTAEADSAPDAHQSAKSASASDIVHSSAPTEINTTTRTPSDNPINPHPISNSPTHRGAIVAGAVAGAAAAVTLALGIWCLFRRRRRGRIVAFQDAEFTNPLDSHTGKNHVTVASGSSSTTPVDKVQQLKTALTPPRDLEQLSGFGGLSASPGQTYESTELRAELERMREENAMLRRTAVPPPYSDRHRSMSNACAEQHTEDSVHE